MALVGNDAEGSQFDILPSSLVQYQDIVPKTQIKDPGKFATHELIYQTYAGTDITAEILVPSQDKPLALGELQTFSYSVHRENTPVRTLGNVNPRGWGRGPRTIAGSLIFTQFNVYAFYRLAEFRRQVERQLFPLADMLPPFDILISFSNETGSFSKMKVLGVTIVDEGGTMSIDDLVSEQTYTWMARGIQPMVNYLPAGYDTDPALNDRVVKSNYSLNFG